MIKCKSGKCPKTNESVCCKCCEKLSECSAACSDAFDINCDCPDEVRETDETEENLPDLFRKKEAAVIQAMTNLLSAKKELEEKETKVREQLVAAMDSYGIKSFENEFLKVVFVAATTRTTLDSKALKKDLPDVAAKYTKTSNVKASVKITLK